MKLSQEKLNEYIELYLNDLHDYGDDKSYIVLAESTLKSVKKLKESHLSALMMSYELVKELKDSLNK